MRTKNYPGARIKSEPSRRVDSAPGFSVKYSKVVRVGVLPAGMSDSDKWKLGGCPRCYGDIFLDSENGALLGHCLQCGYEGARVITTVPRPK